MENNKLTKITLDINGASKLFAEIEKDLAETVVLEFDNLELGQIEIMNLSALEFMYQVLDVEQQGNKTIITYEHESVLYS